MTQRAFLLAPDFDTLWEAELRSRWKRVREPGRTEAHHRRHPSRSLGFLIRARAVQSGIDSAGVFFWTPGMPKIPVRLVRRPPQRLLPENLRLLLGNDRAGGVRESGLPLRRVGPRASTESTSRSFRRGGTRPSICRGRSGKSPAFPGPAGAGEYADQRQPSNGPRADRGRKPPGAPPFSSKDRISFSNRLSPVAIGSCLGASVARGAIQIFPVGLYRKGRQRSRPWLEASLEAVLDRYKWRSRYPEEAEPVETAFRIGATIRQQAEAIALKRWSSWRAKIAPAVASCFPGKDPCPEKPRSPASRVELSPRRRPGYSEPRNRGRFLGAWLALQHDWQMSLLLKFIRSSPAVQRWFEERSEEFPQALNRASARR